MRWRERLTIILVRNKALCFSLVNHLKKRIPYHLGFEVCLNLLYITLPALLTPPSHIFFNFIFIFVTIICNVCILRIFLFVCNVFMVSKEIACGSRSKDINFLLLFILITYLHNTYYLRRLSYTYLFLIMRLKL